MMDSWLFYSNLAAIWWLFAFVYHDYKIDETRQMLFQIRDELFDKAYTGELSFDDQAYGLTRNTINGLIRFTHKLSLIRLLIMLHFLKTADSHNQENFSRKLTQALQILPDDKREIYQMAFMRAHLTITLHIVQTSFTLSLLLTPLRAILFLSNKIRNLKNQYNHKMANAMWFSANKKLWKVIDARANYISHCH